MKKTITALLLLMLTVHAQDHQSSGAEICSEGRQNRSFLEFSERQSLSSPTHAFDILHYSLDLDLFKNYTFPFPHSFSGSITLQLRADSIITSITLDAATSSLAIDSVYGAGVTFAHSNNMLTIQLDKSYQINETLVVKILYRHLNIADNAFYVGNDGMVFTDAEPEGARKWFPCWDKPSDKATMELRAKVPAAVKLGSNGLLVDTLRNGDSLWFHWKSNEPVATYLMVISSKINYNLDIVYWKKLSNQNDSIPIFFYWNTGESKDGLDNIKKKILPMTDRFSTLFGEHPFQKNGFATMNSQFTWGGMENQTLTSLMPDGYIIENLVSHEYSHQWFGDMITCATWADIWLNEGFATYCEALWYEYTSSYSAYRADISYNARSYLRSNPGRPIYNPAWAVTTPPINQLFSTTITYFKSSCVLHMLRYVLGDSLFFAALHSYALDLQFKYKTATTADFVNKINEATNQDLTWFFDQWLKVANHPAYDIQYSLDQSMKNVSVQISQSQTTGTYWKMPVEMRFRLANARDTTVKVFNSANQQLFQFSFPVAVVRLTVDPDSQIVLKTLSVQEVTSVHKQIGLSMHYQLQQNYPNPFNPETVIEYALPQRSHVMLQVYDILGRKVEELLNQISDAGVHSITWNASHLPSGVYYYTMNAGQYSETRTMILAK